ncbi:MAG: enoyl-CoA hydratase/isomerase family protein, partial [Acidobacteria bacterium]|nr:enoyl-CoA hydratase/isomerase family protein [Acidobacteriota bacterium]
MSPAPPALVVAMRHGPANALDPGRVRELRASRDGAGQSGRPLVLTGNGRFFSAGLDLAGLPEDRDEMGEFVDAFDEFVRRLFLFPCPTVAAVNGHAVAGGAILATACDVRIGATGAYRIGVSEVQLGVIFPAAAFEVLRAAVPPERTAEVL